MLSVRGRQETQLTGIDSRKRELGAMFHHRGEQGTAVAGKKVPELRPKLTPLLMVLDVDAC